MGIGIYRMTILFGTLLFLVGCASEPVPLHRPANHPANPDAAEVAYSPPPNPFQDKMPMSEMKPMQSPSMPRGGHMGGHQQNMKPEGKSHDESTENKPEESGHSH
jgi:hypothetical protein